MIILKRIAILALILSFTSTQFVVAQDSSDDQPKKTAQGEAMSTFDPSGLTMDVNTPGHDPASAVDATPVDPKTQRITLELKGVDVLDVLKILSTRSGINIVAGKNVRGQVTIYLKDVLISEALNTIIAALGLAYHEDEGIIKVMTEKEFQDMFGKSFRDRRITKTFRIKYAEPSAIQQIVQQLKGPQGKVILDERTNTLIVTDVPEIIEEIANAVKELDEPLITKVFKLEFASVEDLEEQLQDYMSKDSGILKIDKRSNKIAVTDRAARVEQIEKLVKEFDVRPLQVLIQAQLVQVQLFDAFRFGIDWDYVRTRLKDFRDVNFNPALSVTAPASNLGGGSLSTFTLGTAGAHGLTTVLNILQNVGKTNTLSAPRVTVLNNEEAKLTDATRQPYVNQTTTINSTISTSTPEVQFIDVGVTLTVVPTISDDNTVILKLKPEVSVKSGDLPVQSSGGTSTTPLTNNIPIVSTQSLETTVSVKNGETLVVGGLIKDQDSKIMKKLPILGDIPFIKTMFKTDSNDFSKSELVIFLTPHIISGNVSTKETEKYLNKDGEFVDFDLVGGYDFTLGQTHSQGGVRIDNKPYWKIEQSRMPRFAAPTDVYTRAEPYKDKVNQFETYAEGQVPKPKDELIEVYEKMIGGAVIAELESISELKTMTGKVDLSMVMRRDGVLQEVSFIDVGPIKNRPLRKKVLDAIRAKSPYDAFPKGLDSNYETLDLRFELQPQPVEPKK